MTPSLIRAARGLVNWQQQDLADKAGLSLSAVNNFERSIGKTRKTTIESMVTALENAGVEFLPSGGVRQAEDITNVRQYSGKDFIHKMNEDIYASVRKPSEEIYTCSTDETQWFAPGVKDAALRYYDWRNKMAIKELYLVAEGNDVFEAPRQLYRFLPANLIGKITYVIYADRIALINWRKKQVFILRGNPIVDPFREQFKFLWRLARKA